MSKMVITMINKTNNMYENTGGSLSLFSLLLKPESYSNSPMTITKVLRSPKPGVLNGCTWRTEI